MDHSLRGELMDTVQSQVAAPRRNWLVAAWYGLSVLLIVSILSNINRALVQIVGEPLRISLGLTDGHLGMLNGLALTLVSAIGAIPLGWLADKIDRRLLLGVCVLIWSGATIVFGLSTSFNILFIAAMGIALGEAVVGPITYSAIPDLFPRDKWALANSIFVFAILIGSYGGFALSGVLFAWVSEHSAALPQWIGGHEPWRTTLILSAFSGPIAVLLIASMRLKRKAMPESTGEKIDGFMTYFRRHYRSILGIFIGFGLSYSVFGASSVWTPVILQRTFGIGPAEVGKTIGTFGMMFSVLGVIAGYLCVKHLRPRYGDFTPMIVAQWALLVGVVISCFTPFVQSATQYYVIVISKVMFMFMATSLTPTIIQTLAPRRMLGRVAGLAGMIAFGFQSIFPWLIGEVSDSFFTGPRGILLAMSMVILPALIIGLLVVRWGAVTIPATLREVAAEDEATDAKAAAAA